MIEKRIIPLFKMSANENDAKAVSEVVKRGSFWAEGQEIDQFERMLCKYFQIHGALVCNSGTSALHMAVIATGIKHFHEVIVPSFTHISTVNCVRFVGAQPVFADIEGQTFGLDPVDVESKITPKTKAIIVVHYAGCPCRIQELKNIARKYKLALIEDVAEAMGAKYEGKAVGRFGDCAILSFCQNKIISTGEGGTLITDDKYIYDKARLLRSHGREDANYFNSSKMTDYVELGYNWRMPTMNAALGISQLSRIEDLITARQEKARLYNSLLANLPDVIVPVILEGYSHVYQLFTIRVLNGKRDKVLAYLTECGVGCKVYFPSVHLTAFYRRDKWQAVSLPVTERISQEVLSLPMYPDLADADIEYICGKVKEALC